MIGQGRRFARTDAGRTGLWVEFLGLYLVAPVLMALAVPPERMFPALFAVTVVGVVLLTRTPGFSWAELRRQESRFDWRLIGLIGLATLVTGVVVLWLTEPGALFFLLRQQPGLLLLILCLYPLLSALPQELVFRALFFRRYAPILPRGKAALWLNAAVFSFAHLMYWNLLVAGMTFAGGLVFAHVYARQGNFPLAVALHAVAGNVVFLVGLGVFFYSGNVVRPF